GLVVRPPLLGLVTGRFVALWSEGLPAPNGDLAAVGFCAGCLTTRRWSRGRRRGRSRSRRRLCAGRREQDTRAQSEIPQEIPTRRGLSDVVRHAATPCIGDQPLTLPAARPDTTQRCETR